MYHKNKDAYQGNLLRKLKKVSIREFPDFHIEKLLYTLVADNCKYSVAKTLFYVFHKLMTNSRLWKFALKGMPILLISYEYERQDHRHAWNLLKDQLCEYDEILLFSQHLSLKTILPIRIIFKSFKVYKSIFHQLKCFPKKEAHLFAATLAELHRFYTEFNLYTSNRKYNVAVVYFDGALYENLLIQNFRNRNVKTVTLQHGQPVYHGYGDFLNQAMILNFSSDFFIATGAFTRKQFLKAGFLSNQIKIIGTLRNVKETMQQSTFGFAVFFDCPTYSNAITNNKKLTAFAEVIAKRYGLSYSIKLHPLDSFKNYSGWHSDFGHIIKENCSVEEILRGREFALLHASGVYLDILAERVKCFCFIADTDFPLVEFDFDAFKSVQEFEIKYNQWNALRQDSKENYLNQVIEYYLGTYGTLNRYGDFISSFS